MVRELTGEIPLIQDIRVMLKLVLCIKTENILREIVQIFSRCQYHRGTTVYAKVRDVSTVLKHILEISVLLRFVQFVESGTTGFCARPNLLALSTNLLALRFLR